MGSPFGGPIFMPALSWLHGSACLWRRGTQVAGAGDGRVGAARVGEWQRWVEGPWCEWRRLATPPRLRWAMQVATMGVESAASVMQAAAEPCRLERCGRWGGAGGTAGGRACGKRAGPGRRAQGPFGQFAGPRARTAAAKGRAALATSSCHA